MMESTIGNHTGPQDIETMKETKKEVENKVAKILKLIKNNAHNKKGRSSADKKAELIGLVEDFHKQYQSLFERYDHLREEMDKKAPGGKERENCSSTSSSDLDYYSPDEVDDGLLISEDHGGESSTMESLQSLDIAALHEIQEAKTVNKDPMNKVDKRKGEISATVKERGVDGIQESAQIKELEGQLTVLKNELESLCRLKHDLEAQIENKTIEAKQLREKNVKLQARISELELIFKEKGDEAAAIPVKLNDDDKNMTTRIEDLVAQVSRLQLEVESLRSQKGELEKGKRNEMSAQAKRLKYQINVMQQEINSIENKNGELELHLDMKTKELAESQVQIETLKDEMERKTIFQQRLAKEKEDFMVQVEDTQSLLNQNKKMEELLRSKSVETDQLREDNVALQARISDLEGMIADGRDELLTSQKNHKDKENEASTQIKVLEEQVDRLQQKLDSVLSEKHELEMENERRKLDSAGNRIQGENEVMNLTSKITDQQKILKEQEDTIKKYTEELKVAKQPSVDSPRQRSLDSPKCRLLESPRLNHHNLERKVDELAERFHMKMENHIRLLYQRIVVAEKIHYETKDSYKKVKDRLEQESRELNERTAAFESELGNLREMLMHPGNDVLAGLELVVRKVDKHNENFLNCIASISNELQYAKNWISGKNNEIKKLKHDVDRLTAELEDKGKKEVRSRKRVSKWEVKRSQEGGGKPSMGSSELERKVPDLEQQLKEKDRIILGLGEEKREAIRQLCVSIEYQRNRYDCLKRTVSKMAARPRGTT